LRGKGPDPDRRDGSQIFTRDRLPRFEQPRVIS
jgi:hypothetical protein